MPRFTAFLRGVSPMNAKMPELKAAFESAGFANVRTVLASGNVVFDSERTDEREIERLAEEAMMRALGRSFYTVVRSCAHLAGVLATDWYDTHGIPPEAKRVITFMRESPVPRVPLPLTEAFASVLLVQGREAFSAYRPSGEGPVFMRLIEQAFGKDVTTRTMDTVARCARA